MLKRYEKYKKTKFNLLKEIPDSWELQKIKFVASIYNGDSLNDEYKLMFESENPNDVAYISSKDIDVDTTQIQYENGLRIPKDFPKFKIAPANTSLLCIEGGSAGRKLGFTNQNVYFVNKLACFNVSNKTTSKYLFYCIRADIFQNQFHNSITGMIGGVSISNLKNFYLAFPSIEEQSCIVRYLDHQTAIIDQLIQQKEKLIELLKEKRQAVINEAVTKGLNPDAKMKNSGIEWLGEVPEGWNIIKLKFIIDQLESGVSVNSENSPIEIDSIERAVLKTSCVFNYSFIPEENKKVVQEEFDRIQCPVRGNSIIISRMNTPELVGASGYVDRDYPNLFLPDRLWQTVFKDDVELDVEFLSFVLKSEVYRNMYWIIATGTSPSMKNISQNSFLALPIPFPEIETQKKIKTYLRYFVTKASNAINALENSIEKLKEYRQSIISEAVTGKIDVRDWKLSEPQINTD